MTEYIEVLAQRSTQKLGLAANRVSVCDRMISVMTDHLWNDSNVRSQSIQIDAVSRKSIEEDLPVGVDTTEQ